MRRILLLTAAALAVAAALFTVAACGGSSGTSASPSPTGPAVVSHDTSSPAKALIGHWKDANAMDQYFDGSVWSTVTSGNERWKYGYLVQSEDAKKRVVVLKTFTIQADGSTDKDVEVITFHFLNEAMTQVQWGVGGVTADYVNGHVRP